MLTPNTIARSAHKNSSAPAAECLRKRRKRKEKVLHKTQTQIHASRLSIIIITIEPGIDWKEGRKKERISLLPPRWERWRWLRLIRRQEKRRGVEWKGESALLLLNNAHLSCVSLVYTAYNTTRWLRTVRADAHTLEQQQQLKRRKTRIK